jgi:CubicO group peptidase (beta-lactamase class C family)
MTVAKGAKRNQVLVAIVSTILALAAMASPVFGSDSAAGADRVAGYLGGIRDASGFANAAASFHKGGARSWVVGGSETGRGTNPPDSASRFRIGSVTKVFVALAALDLARKGRLDLDARVSLYVFGFRAEPRSRSESIKVRHLLEHTSGLPRGEQLGLVDFGEDSLVAATSGLRLIFDPGTDYSYSNLGYDLLGNVLAKAAGMDARDYIRDSILLPMGLVGTGFLSRPGNGRRLVEPYPENPLAYCDLGDFSAGMYSSAADLANLADWLLGSSGGLPDSLRDSLLRPLDLEGGGSSSANLFGQVVTTKFGDVDVRDGAVKGGRTAILLDRRNSRAIVLLRSGMSDVVSMGLDAFASGSGFAPGWWNWMLYDPTVDGSVFAKSREELKEWAGTYAFAFTPIQRPRKVGLTKRNALGIVYDSLSLETADFDGPWNSVGFRHPRTCFLLFRCQVRGVQPLIFARGRDGRRKILAKGASGLSIVAVGLEGLEVVRSDAVPWEGSWMGLGGEPRLVVRMEDDYLLLSDARWSDPTVWRPLERLDDSTLVVAGVGRDQGMQLRKVDDSTLIYRHSEVLRRR